MYEQVIRTLVETEGNIGKIVSIDIDSGDYTIDDDAIASARLLLARRPDAAIYGARIGYDAMFAVGGTLNRTASLALGPL
ncbi:MAG: hypothetical protein NT029_21895 [Armatimonadetes bacterium]|nr:hypothetical protein [Armatimonadota bacterium]